MKKYLDQTCPACGRTLRVRTQYAGYKVACTHCSTKFLVQETAEQTDPRIERLNLELEESQKQLAVHLEQSRLLQQQVDQESAAQRELHRELHEQLKAAEEALAEKDQSLVGLQQQVQELTGRLEAERSESAAARSQLESELARSVKQLQDSHSAIESLTGELNVANNQLVQAQSELEQAKADLDARADLTGIHADPPLESTQVPDDEEHSLLIAKLDHATKECDRLRSIMYGMGINVR